ncbi:MAG: hypothetical protein FWH22_00610, partial [Fibromonadales bacterium]|nr:hypothetical protein [Fibromonadales bacterium]
MDLRNTILKTMAAMAIAASAAFSQGPYIITGTVANGFTVSGGSESIATEEGTAVNQTAFDTFINEIRADANGNAVTLTFGENGETLDLGTLIANFNNTSETWGKITLEGKITAANNTNTNDANGFGIVDIRGNVSVESSADIANTGTGPNVRPIHFNSSGTLDVVGGTISGNAAVAVYNRNTTGTINIKGGTMLSNTSGGSTVFNQSTGTINISGGLIQNNSYDGAAVRNQNAGGKLHISGGTIRANNNAAVSFNSNLNASGEFTLSGNAVLFAQRANTIGVGAGNVIQLASGQSFSDIGSNVVVIAWDNSQGIVYVPGSSEALVIESETGSAEWAVQDGENGIAYENGDNSGFIAIAGLVLNQSIREVDITGKTIAVAQAEIQEVIGLATGSDNKIVTVTGEITGANANNLTIDIPADVTVKWGA